MAEQNSSGNLKILQGIGRHGKIFGRRFGKFEIFRENLPKLWDNKIIPGFWEDFYLDIRLLNKRH